MVDNLESVFDPDRKPSFLRHREKDYEEKRADGQKEKVIEALTQFLKESWLAAGCPVPVDEGKQARFAESVFKIPDPGTSPLDVELVRGWLACPENIGLHEYLESLEVQGSGGQEVESSLFE